MPPERIGDQRGLRCGIDAALIPLWAPLALRSGKPIEALVSLCSIRLGEARHCAIQRIACLDGAPRGMELDGSFPYRERRKKLCFLFQSCLRRHSREP